MYIRLPCDWLLPSELSHHVPSIFQAVQELLDTVISELTDRGEEETIGEIYEALTKSVDKRDQDPNKQQTINEGKAWV